MKFYTLLLFLLIALVSPKYTYGQANMDNLQRLISDKKAAEYRLQIEKLGLAKAKPEVLYELSMYDIYQRKKNNTNLATAKTYLKNLSSNKHFATKGETKGETKEKIKILEAVVSSKLGDSASAVSQLKEVIKLSETKNYHEVKAWAYYELTINNWPKAGRSLLEKSFESALKGKDDRISAVIGHVYADMRGRSGENEKAKQIFSSADKKLHALNKDELGKYYSTKARFYTRMGNFSESLKWAIASLDANQAVKDSEYIANSYFAVGVGYKNVSEFEKGLTYLFKAMPLFEQQNKNYEMCFTAEEIALCYLYMKQMDKGIKILLDFCKKTPPQSATTRYRIDKVFLQLYTRKGDYENAKYYEKLLTGPTYPQFANSSDIPLGDYYFKFNDYKNARKYLQRIIDQGIHSPFSIEKLAKIDSIEGDFKSSLKNYHHFFRYRDSIRGVDRQLLIRDMRYNFDIKEKDFALALKDADIRLKQKDLLTVKQRNELLAKETKLKASQLQTAKLQGQKNTAELKLKDQNITFLNKQSASQQKTLSLQAMVRNIMIIVVVLALIVIYLLIRQYKAKQSSERLLASQNTELEQLVKEKSWLLKEMHHRVKNNLQIVISLLNAQYSHLHSEVAMAAIQESQHRMHSISLIHQKLYQSDNLAYIDMKEYINELINYLTDSFDTNRRIKIVQNVKAVGMDVSQAVPMGLILNEAITNAIKYAFNPQDNGEINISLDEIDSQTLSLVIADNGKGMPKDFDLKTTSSLGMTLIKGLAKQLGGDLKLTNKNGLTIHMLIKRVEILIRNEQLTTKNS